MAQRSLLFHIMMIVVAGAIGFLYVYPTIGQIRQNQDMAVVFAREVAQVSGVNSQLEQKLTAINSIPLQEKQRLVTYMPDTLDDVSILRTMEAILISSGIEPLSLKFDSGGSADGDEQTASSDNFEGSAPVKDSKTVQSEVSLSIEVSEATLFRFFEAVERSEVPFVVKKVVLAPSEKGGVSAELVYLVHSLAEPTLNTVTNDNTMDMVNFDF